MKKSIRYILLLLVFSAFAMSTLNTYMLFQLEKEIEAMSNYMHADDHVQQIKKEINEGRYDSAI